MRNSLPIVDRPIRFAEDFVWGAATSAYQIEGHVAGGAGATHWDTFAATPGNVRGAADGARACPGAAFQNGDAAARRLAYDCLHDCRRRAFLRRNLFSPR